MHLGEVEVPKRTRGEGGLIRPGAASRNPATASFGRVSFVIILLALAIPISASPAQAGDTGHASFGLLPAWPGPWVLSLALGCLLVAIGVAVHRARLRQLAALELQRARIAIDLHDEIGSGLGSIGILADLAAGSGISDTRRLELLEEIGATASELNGAMVDIVRSLRAGSETMQSLALRLSERARRLFPGRGAGIEMRFPDAWPSAPISPAVARSILMIGQEALHNAARHADSRRVVLALSSRGRLWQLEVADDGRGLGDHCAGFERHGLGLESMRLRAEGIGARLRIESRSGQGTTVSLFFDPCAEDRQKSAATATRLPSSSGRQRIAGSAREAPWWPRPVSASPAAEVGAWSRRWSTRTVHGAE